MRHIFVLELYFTSQFQSLLRSGLAEDMRSLRKSTKHNVMFLLSNDLLKLSTPQNSQMCRSTLMAFNHIVCYI